MVGILIGVLFAFMFGGMLLILALGASRVRDETHDEGVGHLCPTAIPGFFVVTRAAPEPRGPLDEALLGQLQRYLDAEQMLAAEFVARPSLESLYRESGRWLTH